MYICLCHYHYMCTSVGSLHSEAAQYIQTNEEKASWSHSRNLHTNNHNKLQFRCLVYKQSTTSSHPLQFHEQAADKPPNPNCHANQRVPSQYSLTDKGVIHFSTMVNAR